MPSSHRRHFGSIRKLPSGRFQTSYWHKDRHYLAPSTFRTKGDAQAWLSSIETDIARGTWLDPAGAKVTVGEWLQHWLTTVVDGRVDSDNTRSNYAQIVRVHIEPALGAIKLDKLAAEMVDQFLATKAKAGLARTHVSRMRTILADALRHAERRGLVARNAGALAVMPRTRPPAERRSLTADEARALLQAAKGERLEAMVVVGLTVGLRPGELTGLLWADIDLDAKPPTIAVSGAMKRGPDGRVKRGQVKRSKDGRRTIALPPPRSRPSRPTASGSSRSDSPPALSGRRADSSSRRKSGPPSTPRGYGGRSLALPRGPESPTPPFRISSGTRPSHSSSTAAPASKRSLTCSATTPARSTAITATRCAQ